MNAQVREINVGTVAHLGGHTFTATATHHLAGHKEVAISIEAVPLEALYLTEEIVAKGGHGLIQRLENRLHGLEATLTITGHQIERTRTELAAATTRSTIAFPHANAQDQARAELARIDAAMAAAERAATRASPTEPEQPAANDSAGITPHTPAAPAASMSPLAEAANSSAPHAPTTPRSGPTHCRPPALPTPPPPHPYPTGPATPLTSPPRPT